jgi:hypothetical protein
MKELEVADELVASLSEMAYPTKQVEVDPPERKKRYKSRFFFMIDSSIHDLVKSRSRVVKGKKLRHVDEEIENRLKAYKSELSPKLAQNLDAVREFFLTVIGPRTLAGSAGADQAKEIVQRLLNTEVDSTQFDKFDRMSHMAVSLAMADFIAKYYKLPKSATQQILASIMPRQPMSIPIPPLQESNYESRHAKARRETASQRAKEASERSPKKDSRK